MSETVLGVELKVTCANHAEHEDVTMKIIDGYVLYLTKDGEELKGDCAVQDITGGMFLAGMDVISAAIWTYRRQG